MAPPGYPRVLGGYWPTRNSIDPKTVRRVFVLVGIFATIASALVAVAILRVAVSFSTPTPCGTSCWDFEVTHVSVSEAVTSFTVSLYVEGSGSPVSAPLAPGVLLGAVTFTDLGAPNRLDAGDTFRFDFPVDPVDEGPCHLGLDYLDLHRSGSVTWAC